MGSSIIFALRTLVKLLRGPAPAVGGGLRKRRTRSPSVTSGARSPTKSENSRSSGPSLAMAGLTALGLDDVVEDDAQLALKGRAELGMKIGGLAAEGVSVWRMREARCAVGNVMKA